MRNEQIKNITFCSIMIALILLLSFSPLGYVEILAIPITIIHIPVLIGSIVLGKKYGLILGGVFGVTSMILSFMSITTQAPFTNPIVSVVPRMLFGFIVFPIYSLFNKKIEVKAVANGLTMAVCTLFHTVVVLTVLYFITKSNFFFGADDYLPSQDGNTSLFKTIYLVFTTNGIIEIALAVLVGTPISIAMDTILHRDFHFAKNKKNEKKENMNQENNDLNLLFDSNHQENKNDSTQSKTK